MSSVEKLLIKAQPGCKVTIREHIERGERILQAIQARFPEVKNVHGLRAKHARWVLHVWCTSQGHSPTTRYHYFRTIRAIAAALGRWDDWKPYVNGPWVRTGQGRQPKLVKR